MGNTTMNEQQPKHGFMDNLFFKQVGPGNKPYSDSKLASALFSMELGKRLEGTGVRWVEN
jgi:hypothetical protein